MSTLVIKEKDKYLSFIIKGNNVYKIHRQKGEVKIGTVESITEVAKKRNAESVFITHTCNVDFNLMAAADIKAITTKIIL